MPDTTDFTQLEDLFRQEHEELINAPTMAALQHRVIADAQQANTSANLARALQAETNPDRQKDLRCQLSNALQKEAHPAHPDNQADRAEKADAIKKAIAAYRPVIQARRDFATGKRAELVASEAEFFKRHGVTPQKTTIHAFIDQFEFTTSTHEMLLTRHSATNFPQFMPHNISRLLKINQGAAPAPALPIHAIPPLERRAAEDTAFNAKDAMDQNALQLRMATNKKRAEADAVQKRDAIRKGKEQNARRQAAMKLASESLPEGAATAGILAQPDSDDRAMEGVGEEEVNVNWKQ